MVGSILFLISILVYFPFFLSVVNRKIPSLSHKRNSCSLYLLFSIPFSVASQKVSIYYYTAVEKQINTSWLSVI